ncbi:MAG TPA: integrin alpha, partial [Candidatus Sumerlaeota bacterium]|nr:integrin alpha [Candidatus Sumerlaeota bacterium]
FIVSAPDGSPLERQQAGQAFVVLGSEDGPTSNGFQGLDFSSAITILGAEMGDKAGMSVSGAGDFNGDGFSDILVGVSFATTENVADNHGEVFIIFGGKEMTGGKLIDLKEFNSSQGVRITGLMNDMNFTGCSVTGVGNIDGRHNPTTKIGYDDIMIGAWGVGNDNSGRAYIIYGNNTPLSIIDLQNLSFGEGTIIKGIGLNHKNLGSSVCGAGDVNGDGVPDLIVAADVHAENTPAEFAVFYLIYGPKYIKEQNTYSQFPLELDLGAPAPEGLEWVRLEGISAHPIDNEHGGIGLAGVGDVNGDGFADFLIGAPAAEVNGIANTGQAYLVFGSPKGIGVNGSLNLNPLSLGDDANGDDNPDMILIQGQSGAPTIGMDFRDAYFGYSVTGAGDVNSDGYCDFMIGAPGLNLQGVGPLAPDVQKGGGAFLVFGGPYLASDGGIINLFDAGASRVAIIPGGLPGGNLGWSLSGAGFVDGDGISD